MNIKILIIGLLCSQLAYANDHKFIAFARVGESMPKVKSGSFPKLHSSVTKINKKYSQELGLAYFINDNFALSTRIEAPRHTEITTYNNLSKMNAVARVKMLSPLAMLEYHCEIHNVVHPYVALGVVYSYFYDSKPPIGIKAIKYKSTFNPVIGAGVNVNINDSYVVNLNYKFAKATIPTNIYIDQSTYDYTKVKANISNIALGLGYRF